MGVLSPKLRNFGPRDKGYTFWCPACREQHAVSDAWFFNGNVTFPTFSPSILVTGLETEKDAEGKWTGGWVKDKHGRYKDQRCHSYVTDGNIQFLSDSDHAMAGQTVPLPDLPQWLKDEPDDD